MKCPKFLLKLILILIIGFKFEVHGQSNMILKDMKMYYHAIYQAEKHIMSDQIDSAAFYYGVASNHHLLFTNHAHNACIASVNINSYEPAAEYAELLISRGISIEFFKQNDFFNHFVQSQEWQKMVEKNIKPTYDQTLRQYVLDLLELDQEFRSSGVDEEKRIQTDYKIEVIIDSLFDRYGYITDDLIGVFPENDKIFRIRLI